MSQNVVLANQSHYRQLIIAHANKSLFNLVTKSHIILNFSNQALNESSRFSKNYLLSNAIENVFILSNVHQNQSSQIEESFNKKIKHEFFARRVEFEKKLTKKRSTKTVSKSSTSSSTTTNLSKLVVQLDRHIDKQRDFIDEIANKFRYISKIVVKIKVSRNAKKINNVFKKITKFCKKIVVIVENQIVDVIECLSKSLQKIYQKDIKQIYHKRDVTFYNIL